MAFPYLSDQQFESLIEILSCDPEPNVYYDAYVGSFKYCKRINEWDSFSIGVFNRNDRITMAILVKEDCSLVDSGWVDAIGECRNYPSFSNFLPEHATESIVLLTEQQKTWYIDHIKFMYEISSL